MPLFVIFIMVSNSENISKLLFLSLSVGASVPISVSVCLYQSLSSCHSFLFSALTFFPVCGPLHSFWPSYLGSVDVRPRLIDQTINYPCITFPLRAVCLTSCLRPYREKEERGWGVQSREGESLQQIVN